MLSCRIRKKINNTQVLQVNFTLGQGQFLAIYGPSGVGKTTLLRILAGLETVDQGQIELDATPWLDTERSIALSPQQRRCAFVFQDYALFPNMTVEQNVVYAQASKNTQFVEQLLRDVDLWDLRKQYPKQLSGGQQQRLALARALAMQAKLLLLDEPFSAVDVSMRRQLQQLCLRLHHKYACTTILVSHSLAEVLSMADVFLVLKDAKVAILQDRHTFVQTVKGEEPFQIAEVLHIEGEQIQLLLNGRICTLSSSTYPHVQVGDFLQVPIQVNWSAMQKIHKP